MPKEGKKNDQEKAPLDLIPPEAIEDEAKAWGFGATKYGRYNFRNGIAYTRLIAAALRHLFALLRGEDNDPESGLPHESHVRCCMGMLAVMKKTRTDLDDRYKPEQKRFSNIEDWSGSTVVTVKQSDVLCAHHYWAPLDENWVRCSTCGKETNIAKTDSCV